MSSILTRLPQELKHEVFSYLTLDDLLGLRQDFYLKVIFPPLLASEDELMKDIR
jgi:hypothetical protein